MRTIPVNLYASSRCSGLVFSQGGGMESAIIPGWVLVALRRGLRSPRYGEHSRLKPIFAKSRTTLLIL